MAEVTGRQRPGPARRLAYRLLPTQISGVVDRITPPEWFRRQYGLAPARETPPASGFGWTQSPYVSYYTRIWGVFQLADMPIWRNIYRTVPLVKAAIDKTVAMAITDFELYLPSNIQDRDRIIGAIEAWIANHPEPFHNVVEAIAHDLLTYGNCFTEMVFDKFDVIPGRDPNIPAGESINVEVWDTDEQGEVKMVHPALGPTPTGVGQMSPTSHEIYLPQPYTRTVAWDGGYRLATPLKGSKLQWLKVLDPLHLRVRTDSLGNIYGYIQWLAYPPVAFTTDNMIHFRYMPKSWSYERVFGTSKLLSVVRTQNIIWQLENDLVLIAHAAAKPPLLFRLGTKEEGPYGKEQMDAFRNDMSGRGPGADIYVLGDIEGNPLPQPSQNLGALVELLRFHHEQRIVALGVPPQLLGMPEGSTRTTAAVNLDDWLGTIKAVQNTIGRDLRRIFTRILQDQGFPANTPVPQIIWRGLITKDINDVIRQITSLISTGAITVNEARDLLTETGRKFERRPEPHAEVLKDPFRPVTGQEGTNLPQFSQREYRASRMEAAEAPPGASPVERDAFLYLDPKAPRGQFAQCGTCMMFTGSTCTIHGPDIKITKEMACGLYVNGKPMPEEKGNEMKAVTPEESGLVKRQTRCENCLHFGAKESVCTLYRNLNAAHPTMFHLDENVEAKGCCNAHTIASDDERSERPLSS